MSKSGDPSPSSPKKTSANKKASESKEKIAARPAAKNSKTAPKAAPVKKNSAKAAAPAGRRQARCGKGRRQARCGKKGPGKKSVSGFCLQEGGAVRQKDSGKGA